MVRYVTGVRYALQSGRWLITWYECSRLALVPLVDRIDGNALGDGVLTFGAFERSDLVAGTSWRDANHRQLGETFRATRGLLRRELEARTFFGLKQIEPCRGDADTA
jgi:hypothetical protein